MSRWKYRPHHSLFVSSKREGTSSFTKKISVNVHMYTTSKMANWPDQPHGRDRSL